MLLPFLSKKKKGEDLYFGLFLKENAGVAFIFEGNGKNLHISAKESFNFSNGWENLVNDIDEVLFKLEGQTKTRVEKTIFFVFSHLINEKTKEIKKPYLQKIKEIVKNLELKPVGYVECYEAVASFLEQKEQLPLTSILIELDKTNLGVFIYKGGHKTFHETIARTDSIIEDLLSIFKKIKGTILLPSRIILYNSSNLIDESTKIISFRWATDLFVQLPRVEIIKEEEIYRGFINLFKEQIYQKEPEKESDHQEVLGFVIGGDVLPKPTPSPMAKKEKNNYFLNITNFINGFKLFHFSPFILGAVITGLFIIFMAFIFTLFFHKAFLEIDFPTDSIDKTYPVTSIIGSQDSNSLVINVATVSAEIKESKTTTGKKDIGDKAKGEVTMYNFDDKEKLFSKGTVLQSGGFKFLLDSDIKVAASSLASDASAKLPGKAKIQVTANEIGPESNLGKGERLTVADLSQNLYFAINEASFSGGTKKSIRTVAKKDIEDLKSIIMKKAQEGLQDKPIDKLTKNDRVLESISEVVLENLVESKEVGEEGDKIEIKAKVAAKFYFYKKETMINFIKNKVKQEVLDGQELIVDKIKYNTSKVKKDKEKISLTLTVSAKTMKKIEVAEIRKQISGKTKKQAEGIIKNEFGAKNTHFKITPPLFFIDNIIPFLKRNIEIKIIPS